MNSKRGKAKLEKNRTVISFKVSPQLFDEIESYARTQSDEQGNTLTTSQAARRLMLEAMKRLKK